MTAPAARGHVRRAMLRTLVLVASATAVAGGSSDVNKDGSIGTNDLLSVLSSGFGRGAGGADTNGVDVPALGSSPSPRDVSGRQDRALQEGCTADNRDWRGPDGERCHSASCSVAGAVENCGTKCCEHRDELHSEPRSEAGNGTEIVMTAAHRGGHVTDLWRTSACVPVPCGPDAPFQHHLHGEDTAIGHRMAEGCNNYSIFNFMKQEHEQIYLTCQACVPHTCAVGEHDCQPVYCEDESGEIHGRMTDPCLAGHHDDDGLAWWPFLLVCLITTVFVSTVLHKLNNGACFGKSINPPFTVVMFFFGYYVSHVCVLEADESSSGLEVGHSGILELLFKSVLAWKAAHPHVILFVLLPPLLFEDASGMDYYVFRKVLMSSIILAGPGVGISMLLTAASTMLLFGFAEECVVETDNDTGVMVVAGARENTVDEAGVHVCDPATNPDWQDYRDDAGGLICLECVQGSHRSEQLPISIHLLLGGMLAATDPVAVCAVLNDLGCPAKLNYMIAGESLLNDGTAVVAFMVMQSVAGGCDADATRVLITLFRLAGGGVLWGLLMSATIYEGIKHVRNPNIEITALVFATLSTFWLAENVLGFSGVLSTVVFGVQTARTSFLAMDEHTRHANHAFWGEVGYVATSFIFILAGVKSRDKIASFLDNFQEDFADDKEAICNEFDEELVCLTHHVCRWTSGVDGGDCSAAELEEAEEDFHVGNQLILNFVLWIMLGMIRAGVVALLSPILTKIGYGLSVKEAAVMVWGGLRGAVSLSLALLIDANHLIGDRAREMIFLQTTGIVALTLIINGTTSGMVYKKLNVYPPNPYRPALATQGLRTVHSEMLRYIRTLNEHWFHSNADMDVLISLMPDFSQAHMLDGDLVGIETKPMHSLWSRVMEDQLVPTTLASPDNGMSERSVAGNEIRITELCSQAGAAASTQASRSAAGGKFIVAPNPYGRISLVVDHNPQATFETPVLKNTCSPTWPTGLASHTFALPVVSEVFPHGSDNHADSLDEPGKSLTSVTPNCSVWLEISMHDSDFGEVDKQLGKCRVDISALCTAGGDLEDTFELKDSRGVGSDTSPASSPRCVGTVDLVVTNIVSKQGRELNVAMRHATLFSQAQSPMDPPSDSAHHSDESSHEHGHGEGDHGSNHVDKLRNIKRWLTASSSVTFESEAADSVDHSFAMYDIMLGGMRSNFAHECEKKTISVKAYSELNAAIGKAIDLNEKQMDSERGVNDTSDSTIRASRMSQMVQTGQGESPMDALEAYMMTYADKALKKKEATKFFAHRLLCTEMFVVLIEQLTELADNPDTVSELGGLSVNAIKCCNRCKRKLAEMQVAAPNTMRLCHTLVAFNIVASHFTHRVHAYLDQGFFVDDMANAANQVVLGRQQELGQSFAYNPIVAGLMRFSPIPRSGPAYLAFNIDSAPLFTRTTQPVSVPASSMEHTTHNPVNVPVSPVYRSQSEPGEQPNADLESQRKLQAMKRYNSTDSVDSMVNSRDTLTDGAHESRPPVAPAESSAAQMDTLADASAHKATFPTVSEAQLSSEKQPWSIPTIDGSMGYVRPESLL